MNASPHTPMGAQLDPFPRYATMRQTAPVHYDERTGIWSVFRYDDVQRVLSDYAAFSSQRDQNRPNSTDSPFANSLISLDPPRHRQLRSLVTQAFTPRTVDVLAPRITAIVNELLDQIADHGQMDIIDDLAYPLPVIVIAEMLGIPSVDRDRFKHWSDLIVGGASGMGSGTFNSASREMATYFLEMIERRRHDPRDDLISNLLQAQVEGKHLSIPELLGFCSLLLVAGNETTTNLIGNAMMTLLENRDALDRLVAEPALLPVAIEEVLRYRSPVQSMFRFAVAKTQLGQQEIRAGAMVMAFIGSANRDEGQFPDAQHFLVDRSPNRHIAFGHGIHYCLGAPLARLEARITLEILLQRITDITLEPDVELEAQQSNIVYGVKHLPVRFRSC